MRAVGSNLAKVCLDSHNTKAAGSETQIRCRILYKKHMHATDHCRGFPYIELLWHNRVHLTIQILDYTAP